MECEPSSFRSWLITGLLVGLVVGGLMMGLTISFFS